MKRWSNLLFLVVIPIALYLSAWGLCLCYVLQTSHWPAVFRPLSVFVWFYPLAFFFGPLIGFALPIAAFWLWRRQPKRALVLLVLSGVWWSGLLVRPFQFWPARRTGLEKTTRKAQVLIAAIENYRRAKGFYPDNLQQLVPQFLPVVPSTGMLAYPNFDYQNDEDSQLFQSYELRIETPFGFLNWDRLVYWPEKNYPTYFYGGGTERIGDWAYVHE